MATTNKVFDNELRATYLAKVKELFAEAGEDVLVISNGDICFPVVDSGSNEKWVQVTVKVPTGSREDGEPFDGYSKAEDWQMKLQEKAAKAEENARKKAEKVAKDKAKREAAKAAKEKAKAEKANKI